VDFGPKLRSTSYRRSVYKGPEEISSLFNSKVYTSSRRAMYTYGNCGNFLVSEAVILARKAELVTLCGFFINTNKNPV
jgi:hypothetical protein